MAIPVPLPIAETLRIHFMEMQQPEMCPEMLCKGTYVLIRGRHYQVWEGEEGALEAVMIDCEDGCPVNVSWNIPPDMKRNDQRVTRTLS